MDIGLNFRDTAGYVTDGTNETYVLGGVSGDAYPTTRGGFTFGYTAALGSQFRDRNNALDRRLAGIHFCTSPAQLAFQLDLTASGSYVIHYAGGDPSGAQATYCDIRDNTSSVLVVNDASIAGGSTDDATSTEYTDANWPSSETGSTKTFSTSTLTFLLGTGTSDGRNNMIQHLRVVTAGGGGATPKVKDMIGGGIIAFARA